MSTPNEEARLEVSFPKALLFSGFGMACFVGGCYLIGMPLAEPIFLTFLVVTIVLMTPVFALYTCFMLSCRIGRDGLRPAAPTLYLTLLRWDDIATVRRGVASPFYIARDSGTFGVFCILPARFLLKNPDSLSELIDRYAPSGNIVREKLGS